MDDSHDVKARPNEAAVALFSRTQGRRTFEDWVMQTDMHYYGTYAMARAAGIKPEFAIAAATAAQYVDDSDRFTVTLSDGNVIKSEPTAHHTSDRANVDLEDQRRTWVPFHFIPGGEGRTPGERLLCTKDSTIAQEMVKHHISLAREEYGVLLIGIAAHAYADTFAHYGFSGMSSELNKVDTDSFDLQVNNQDLRNDLKNGADRFWNKYVGKAINLVMLGHGSVATYPDRPYLRWSFNYADGNRKSGLRDNPVTFLAACHKLHQMFIDFGKQVPGYFIDAAAVRSFDAIRQAVAAVLTVEAELEGRIAAWQEAAVSGTVFNNPERAPIPGYDPGTFTRDMGLLATFDLPRASRTLIYQFVRAADVHRQYMLETLLPKNSIVLT